jgi:hypothetical protein
MISLDINNKVKSKQKNLIQFSSIEEIFFHNKFFWSFYHHILKSSNIDMSRKYQIHTEYNKSFIFVSPMNLNLLDVSNTMSIFGSLFFLQSFTISFIFHELKKIKAPPSLKKVSFRQKSRNWDKCMGR